VSTMSFFEPKQALLRNPQSAKKAEGERQSLPPIRVIRGRRDMVFYSPLGGLSWRPVAPEHRTSSADIENNLHGSERACRSPLPLGGSCGILRRACFGFEQERHRWNTGPRGFYFRGDRRSLFGPMLLPRPPALDDVNGGKGAHLCHAPQPRARRLLSGERSRRVRLSQRMDRA